MKKSAYILLAAGFQALCAAGLAHSAVIKVPGDFKTIQSALDAAKPGDTVAVAPGKYKGNVALKEDVVLQGEGADSTIIEGLGSGSVVEGAKGAVIEGFTITGSGKKGTIGVTMDAGISCIKAPMTIANNRITGNNTGIKLYFSPSNLAANFISDSAAYGVYVSYSDAAIENNVITKSAIYGVYNNYSNPVVVNNTVAANSTGIYSEVSRVVVKNNIVSGNKTAGIRWAEFKGSQERAEPVLSYNLTWNNGEDYINADPGAGAVKKDPLFTDAAKGDFKPKPGSPAIKAGEKGTDIGAYGGDKAQASIPVSPAKKSYSSLKGFKAKVAEPEYMSQSAWKEGNTSGKGTFESACVTCHGAEGKGDGILADSLDVRPRNFTDKSIMCNRTDDLLFKVIKDGGESVGLSSSMMPFNNQLSDEEIRNAVKYIRSEFSKCQPGK